MDIAFWLTLGMDEWGDGECIYLSLSNVVKHSQLSMLLNTILGHNMSPPVWTTDSSEQSPALQTIAVDDRHVNLLIDGVKTISQHTGLKINVVLVFVGLFLCILVTSVLITLLAWLRILMLIGLIGGAVMTAVEWRQFLNGLFQNRISEEIQGGSSK